MSNGKVVLVTGSSSGIGKAIAMRLHAEGWHVVLNGYRTDEAGQSLCMELGGSIYVDADVSSFADARRLVQEAVIAFGRLDAVVNNAGVARQVPHHDLDAVDDGFWDRIMAVNLKGPWNVAKAARPYLAETNGQIINNASLAGMTATGSSIPYAISKAGVLHMTRLLAKALGPQIRVNAVAPGYIDTPLTHDWQQLREFVEANAPARRLGQPEDVAEVVHGLLTMDYVTGTVIPVAGGLQLL
ncbi:MAG: SDR family NAD(P)-dependent oxidoreductase [Lacisediminihabitans sp.]